MDTILPSLKWSSPEYSLEISRTIKQVAVGFCWYHYDSMTDESVQDVLAQVQDFDFRYMSLAYWGSYGLVRWLSKAVS